MNTLLTELDALFVRWQACQPLPADRAQRLWQRLRLEWNYNSNHIEGNTLTYGETFLLLIYGRTRGEHLLREYEEMRAHDVAIEHVRALAAVEQPLTEADIRDLNRITLKEGFWKLAQTPGGETTRKWIEPGRYKIEPNHVLTATGEIFQFASPEDTPARMQEFVAWLRQVLESRDISLPMLLADLHHRFITIHPFDDGNGRVVRLVLNYVLLHRGYPPIIIKTRERDRYLAVIQMADAGDLQALAEFMAEGMKWSLELALRASQTLIELEEDEP